MGPPVEDTVVVRTQACQPLAASRPFRVQYSEQNDDNHGSLGRRIG
jgi:hypothetical protein